MSFGEIIPTTWYVGVYKLETDGTDSSGNGNTLPGLNTPNFAVARFGAGGMDGGTSGINRGLRHTTLNVSGGSALTCVQVGMWFKLNTTASITTNSVFYMLQANGGGSNLYEMFALGNISGSDLTVQLVLSTTTTPVTASVTIPADLLWHYITFTVDFNVGGNHLTTVTVDGKTASDTQTRTVFSPGGNRVSIGNHATSSTLQMWGMFDQVTISRNSNRLNFFQLQNRYAQARGMFCI